MQHATCNMQHATCNKNGNKLVSFLAALALTAAALATPSAFGYGVFTFSNQHYGLVVDAETEMEAREQAITECETDAGTGTNNDCRANSERISVIDNECISPLYVFSNDVYILAMESTKMAADMTATMSCNGFNDRQGAGSCQLLVIDDESVCDHTCEFDESERDADNGGCDECMGDTPIGDGVNCRGIENNTDCGNIAMRDDTPELIYYDDDGGCRAALECEADNSITNDSGGCMPCDADETETGTENICETVVCVDPERREGRTCVCVGDYEPVGESCFRKCESPETRVGNTDVCEDMTEMPPEPPEFTIGVGGETDLTTTESDRHEVAFADVSAIQITVATTVAGFMYTKTGGSEQLTVGLTDGVVGFNTTVSAGDYEITVTADNDTVTATISLYLTVAEEIMLSTTPPTSMATPTSSGGGGGGSAAGIIGGVVVVALALWYFTSGSDDLTWTPSYAFANHNGNMSYSVGSRWTATANDWQIYWQTRQTDKFVYGSGMSYNGDILSATMNSESEGKKTAVDVDLSANKTVGLWNLGGGYNFDMQLSETETDTKNRINAKVRYTMDKWILSANANTDGDTGTARINYSYRF